MTTDLELPSGAQRAALTSQATIVEQSRAVAEVQAAVVVAQANPRDTDRAEADMHDTCDRLTLAQRAFYSVPNRGTGPSVHLARELARIWGNVDYGVRELRRDDEAGVSEMQAWAWDQEKNVRSTRSFIQPHARMKGRARQALTDLNDIYLSNQNTGAKAVRECIFTVLPGWFVEDAQARCHATIERGNGIPLTKRIDNAIEAFARLNVLPEQIEGRLGRTRDRWDEKDIASLEVIYGSLHRGETTAADEFPAAATTLDEAADQ